MDCSWGDMRLTSILQIPPELLEVIRLGTDTSYLQTLAILGRDPKFTVAVFTSYEPIFVEICARWLSMDLNAAESLAVASGFAKILPLAPHLATFVEEFLINRLRSLDAHINDGVEDSISPRSHQHSRPSINQPLMDSLLALYRILSFDTDTFSHVVSTEKMQLLFRHSKRSIRFLAIRVLCLCLRVADAAMEDMIQRHVGREAINDQWEGKEIDYLFLSLWEEKRLDDLEKELGKCRSARIAGSAEPLGKRVVTRDKLSPLTAEICGVLLPRLQGQPRNAMDLVPTPTTSENLRSFAEALLTPDPILLTGLAGSGKTLIAMGVARELNVDSSMVTLHLNEQTDAKLLIGMYTTGSTPGSFKWRPGVLTTAVREGRWVFIEDLDRAPTEVLSVILPLIERGELLVPSRGEKVRAARGFKLIATIRSTLNSRGEEIVPGAHMLGMRLWKRVHINMPSVVEFQEIISKSFPVLGRHLPIIINVYTKCLSLFQRPTSVSASKISTGRPLSPRDLLKWCRRLNMQFCSAGLNIGQEPVTDFLHDAMFMEAADCFAGSLQTYDARRTIVSQIAEEMLVPPRRVNYYLDAHTPRYMASPEALVIGRAHLRKQRAPGSAKIKIAGEGRPFATTTHTLRLMEQIAVAIQMSEPVLLVGETGTGKTSVVQQLAALLGNKLTVVNLSQQSESGDLLGGYKPVNIRSLVVPMKEDFDELFESTFSIKKNQRYIDMLGKCVAKSQWVRALTLWREAVKMAEGLFTGSTPPIVGEQPKKKRKLESEKSQMLKSRWEKFSRDADDLGIQLSSGSKSFAFKFMEGKIVKAARNGEWVLLDEINLASPDTLESIADLLYSGPGGLPSILLAETGEVERVQAHPDFRIFGAMNPATDVGKRDLPMGLRSRFAEIYVDSPDTDPESLLKIAKAYLIGYTDERAAHDITGLYLEVKRLTNDNRLVDGANQRPHFSLRTLTRTLSYVVEIAPMYGLRRALYEGFSMCFLTLLDKSSERLLLPLIDKHLLENHRNARSLLGQTPRLPDDGRQYVQFKHYWMPRGEYPVETQPHYIITPFVERNMLNLIRATSTRRFPVLVQGPTSSGKTSMIEYLAKATGNKFVRINNHEHTDLQEYLGAYVSGTNGQLRFQEGVLVQALRDGHWIVLDELNLAPTDVLEALNRLLDDNRELLIPETQEVVRPHKNFMLFATQNPPGLYGGRKILSRAFRNRFLELHFDDIPEDELETILRERSQIAPSFCTRIVAVYKELSLLRQSSRLFEQKNSFATLRDLFRWALRDAGDREQLAENGFMLLAERVRKPEERHVVKQVIERVLKVKIDEDKLYDPNVSAEIKALTERSNSQGVIWTKAMRRLFILVYHALRNKEPVLLVGETGCGKTTVCQMLAESFGSQLFIVNAHQNTETGDLIGAQRPLRNRSSVESQLCQDLSALFQDYVTDVDLVKGDQEELVHAYEKLSQGSLAHVPAELRDRIQANMARLDILFEWSDGSLVHAMKTGQFFLLDEISLADDSVLERLNSVLEPQRTLLLAEKGPNDCLISAAEGFHFLSTMNPGGDYGKRELSPALRNRFTEIWVPSISDHSDVLQIVNSKIIDSAKGFSEAIVQFARWFSGRYSFAASQVISIRDVLAWIQFVNACEHPNPYFGILHGAAMVFIDTIGANPAAMLAIPKGRIPHERKCCLEYLSKLVGLDLSPLYFAQVDVLSGVGYLAVGPFHIATAEGSVDDSGFNLHAPTTKMNALRVIRALQLRKPILLEGNPGVGKTTLITAIAQSAGRPLTRINLSEQTDLMDLFGSDVPVEGAEAGRFAWRDAPFLQAMQTGDWVLLDEMNLASQSVLEGLNACLDHRGEVYISELDQKFARHPDFAVFAAQNPHHQGGGRKGLPSSFVNRFTVVYTDLLTTDDLMRICSNSFPSVSRTEIGKLIHFVAALEDQVVRTRHFGARGGPWEFNLRDILRWLKLLTSEPLQNRSPVDFLDIIFKQRFRCREDRLYIDSIFFQAFGLAVPERLMYHDLNKNNIQVGLAILERDPNLRNTPAGQAVSFKERLPELEALMICVQQNWPCILVGSSGSGKTTLVKQLAAISGACLVEFPLNSDIDTMDLVGGYEQVDSQRLAPKFFEGLELFLRTQIVVSVNSVIPDWGIEAARIFDSIKSRCCERATLIALHELLVRFSDGAPSILLSDLISQCNKLLGEPPAIDKPRFQWVDGTLVEALEQGKWLVLDNANLCSSSVLDRLNSLLEPNGYLGINEHRSPEGDAKVIRPHPDFRIFLTMDPKHGELSRAMRNRAIEIFLTPLEGHNRAQIPSKNQATFEESAKYRFRMLTHVAETTQDSKTWALLVEAGLGHLSFYDMSLLSSWSNQAKIGLMEFPKGEDSIFSLAIDRCNNFAGSLLKNEVLQFYSSLATKLHIGGDFPYAQPIHPLVNAPLVSTLEPSSSMSDQHLLATLYDAVFEAGAMDQALEGVMRSSALLRPSQMTRIERSFASQRIPILAKDSTSPVFGFLKVVGNTIFKWAISATFPEHTMGISKDTFSAILQEAISTWWNTFELVKSTGFEDATFQAHLSLWEEWLAKCSKVGIPPYLIQGVSDSLSLFESSWQLRTGLSMEKLWVLFKPVVPSSVDQLRALSQVRDLADRFDDIIWRVRAPVDLIISLRGSIAKSLETILTHTTDSTVLLQSFEESIARLETKSRGNDSIAPYFAAEIEGLSQYYDMIGDLACIMSPTLQRKAALVKPLMSLFASRPTKLIREDQSAEFSPSQAMHSLSNYVGTHRSPSDSLMALRGTLPTSVFRKLNRIGDVSLKNLDLLKLEMNTLARGVALSGPIAQCHQIYALNDRLCNMLSEVLNAHRELCLDSSLEPINVLLNTRRGIFSSGPIIEPSDPPALEFSADVPEDHHFRMVFQKHLSPCLLHLVRAFRSEKSYAESGAAWAHFSAGCLLLYVPDRAFDPATKPFVEKQRHEKRRKKLEEKLQALRHHESVFTGQSTNMVCKMSEQALRGMGDEPPVPAIVRPDPPQLGRLHGEFSNLLGLTNWSCFGSLLRAVYMGNEDALQEARVMQLNISQLISRFGEYFTGYEDLASPTVGILQSLNLGLSLSALSYSRNNDASLFVQDLSRQTPFLGGRPESLSTRPFGFGEHFTAEVKHSENDRSIGGTECVFHFLQRCSIRSSIEGLSSFSEPSRRDLFMAFDCFYRDWRKKLQDDKKKAAAESSLYRYKGKEDADDEEMRELFPTFDDATDSTKLSPKTTVQKMEEICSRIVKIHANIFAGDIPASANILSLVEMSASQLGALPLEGDLIHEPELLFNSISALLLSLDREIDNVNSDSVSVRYNFYSDANHPETRKLVGIIYKVKSRFSDLRDAWPEHATLQDVLDCCEELLVFRHIEPVAKFLTKAEKLHGFIHEWQVVASKEFSAAPLYDDLTALLIGWRRLELSTWARLFDLEREKCDEQAKSWWFIAYELIVAIPVSLTESKDDLSHHSVELLESLELFFTTTTLGQFPQRLQLLEQLKEHVLLLTKDIEPMAKIYAGLANFLSFYSNFKPQVEETLQKGRSFLEKEMREVVLLASWKDTNIIALRDSARRSHHKLFKLIRKYRALLGQPMQDLLRQGIPDSHGQPTHPTNDTYQPTVGPVDPKAIEICEAKLTSWSTKPARLKNISNTISSMQHIAQAPSTALDGTGYLEEFSVTLISGIKELQSATPSVYSEETKETVKHLKTQKRKLFADTLKQLRQMGLKSSLGTDALFKQRSLCAVLAYTVNFPETATFGGSSRFDLYFHKTLDLTARLREATRGHSEDLNNAEIARSTGYIESLLATVLKQRQALVTSIHEVSTLEDIASKFKSLCALEPHPQLRSRDYFCADSAEWYMKWLPSILEAGRKLVCIHSKLTGQDSFVVQRELCSWRDRWTALDAELKSIPPLPDGITTATKEQIYDKANEFLVSLRDEIRVWEAGYDHIGFLLAHILSWTKKMERVADGELNAKRTVDLSVLDQNLSRTCDLILTAVQKLPEVLVLLPTTVEDSHWMVKQETALISILKSLHVKEVILSIESVLNELKQLEIPGSGEPAAIAAVFAMALPILQQYKDLVHGAIERFAIFHRSICKMSYVLAKSLMQLVLHGFCTPSEESTGQEMKNEKLEGGTGLGEGEGAEDISKDIQDDEDLSELAQEPAAKGESEGIGEEKDAVDIRDELEGEMGDSPEQEDDASASSSDEGKEDIDEEVGDVGDLDPSVVDEKLWDGGDGEQGRDKESSQSKGSATNDEQTAAHENERKNKEDAEDFDDGDEENEGAQENEGFAQEVPDSADPHIPEGDALDLPEEMDFDGDRQSGLSVDGTEDGDADELSDVEVSSEPRDEADNAEDESSTDAPNLDEETASTDDIEMEGTHPQDDLDAPDPDNEGGLVNERNDDTTIADDNIAPSEAKAAGEAQENDQVDDPMPSHSKAERSKGSRGEPTNDQENTATEGDVATRQNKPSDNSRDQNQPHEENGESQAFRELGSALERFHRQQEPIYEAPENHHRQETLATEMDVDNVSFEHLPDEGASHDAQALGAATEEQTHALDESMAVDSNTEELSQSFLPDEQEQEQNKQGGGDMGMEELHRELERETQEIEPPQAGAFIGQNNNLGTEPHERGHPNEHPPEDLSDVDQELSTIHLEDSTIQSSLSPEEARRVWSHYETVTRDLSLSLTEQLRLILAPTLATKMRGDFRTGKRLNIKRIIPYIASQYKRDKIWMRRSVPSKRSYQIMLAVDDSRSMGESGSGQLAFETLALVSKSLSMLEVGEISVVGFGNTVRVAHEFDKPFTNEAGVRILEQFGFQQTKTDVRKLISESINLFREARNQSSGAGTELWQLQLIISDGICEDHDTIRRLVRQAQEERIMIVFIIIDALRGSSIMDMTQAKFEADSTGSMKVKMERYLDGFPFGYYLVVSNVRELPIVFSTALRQWFAEVVDASG
ncbi:hypothetical protein FGG08_006284 [Glutinoglossum americanum]|uniref:Midasin n=1 Tax=Glutinoglossum americanum TaxID=1670608 RepID=A0A9P8HWN1_9PEZI|nr:hypothetical protein FGG08_006284 [Glutinoglossum americanum]